MFFTLKTFSLLPPRMLDATFSINPESSRYFKKESEICYEYLPYFPTIDDEKIKWLSSMLMCAGGNPVSHKKRIKLLLRFFKQNFTYMSDMEVYGSDDYWELPINFISNRGGDCDGYAFAFCCMAHHMGVNAGPVILKGNHMIVKAIVDGKDVFIDPVQSKYNVFIDPNDIIKYSTTEIPSEEFLSNIKSRDSGKD